MHLQALTNAEVEHDLLATTGDLVRQGVAIQPLDFSALPAARVRQPTKDLSGLLGAELKGRRGLRLEARNGTAQSQHGFRVVHLLALVDDVLQPRRRGLDLPCHVCQFHADHGMVDQLLAERLSLGCIFDRFLVAHPRESCALDDDSDALVVEVGHDD